MIKRNMMQNKKNLQRVGKHHQLIDFWLSGKYLTITTSFQALQYCYSVLLNLQNETQHTLRNGYFTKTAFTNLVINVYSSIKNSTETVGLIKRAISVEAAQDFVS